MVSVRVTHHIDRLAADLASITSTARKDMTAVVRRNASAGNKLAANFARGSAGAHGKHYHKAFTVEALSPLSYEYGPDASRPQGGMSFEGGSRNQPPHLDLAKSADLIGPRFGEDVAKTAAGWFWP